jgi:histone-lysine N-methyltransferase ASH1L
MGSSSGPSAPAEMTRAGSPESISSDATIDDLLFLNAQSSSSTPPTSIGDSVSVSSSTSLKLDVATATISNESSSRRSIRSSRASVATYNVKVLTGTAIHAPRKYSKKEGDQDADSTRRRTISGDTFVGTLVSANSSPGSVEKDAQRLVSDGIAALDLQWSVKKLPKSKSQIRLKDSPKKSIKQSLKNTRDSPRKGPKGSPSKGTRNAEAERRKLTRSAGEKIESITKKLSVLGKRKADVPLTRAEKELRRLADTAEFAKIDTEPVVHEVWSNGKLVVPEPPNKRKKVAVEEPTVKKEEPKLEAKKTGGKRQKVWLNKGLYAGQDTKDWWASNGWSDSQKKAGNAVAPYKPNGILPLPMWHGQRMLHVGRNFVLPFDICSPLPPGQPKPDEWRKTSSSKSIFAFPF